MKIIVDGKAYVQLNDVMYILHNLEGAPIPAAIVENIFGLGQPFICTDENRYDFMEFDDPAAVKFFQNFEQVIDYLALKDCSEEELKKMGSDLMDKKREIASRISDRFTEEENEKIINQCEFLDLQIMSIRDLIWFKQGHLKFDLPKIPEEKKESKTTGLKGFLNKFKKR